MVIKNEKNQAMEAFAAMVQDKKKNPRFYDYQLNLYKTALKAAGL